MNNTLHSAIQQNSHAWSFNLVMGKMLVMAYVNLALRQDTQNTFCVKHDPFKSPVHKNMDIHQIDQPKSTRIPIS